MKEDGLPIQGYEELYEVSAQGRIRPKRTVLSAYTQEMKVRNE